MSKLKLYIACHKQCDVPKDEVYTPIQVGRAISPLSLDMIGDDTGDNISAKNLTYCETTAHYWVWKNVHDVDYVGFCHYRRFFNYKFTNENVDSLFANGIDVILPKPVIRYFSSNSYLQFVCSEDLAIMRWVIHKNFPEYEPALDEVWTRTKLFSFNMLICRKSLFDEYAQWLFKILDECEKYIKLSPYSRGKRVFGYLAEFLTAVFFIKNNCKIKCLGVIRITEAGIVDNNPLLKEKILGFFMQFIIRHTCKPNQLYGTAHISGLNNDGIPITFD